MSKTARLYSDTRTASAAADAAPSNLDKLNGELQDVTRIMTKNMEELLWRGDSLDREFLSCLSSTLEYTYAHGPISMLSKDSAAHGRNCAVTSSASPFRGDFSIWHPASRKCSVIRFCN